jgi:carbonic anhydrase
VKKVFHFDSPRPVYRADATVVACFDHRIQLAWAKYLKRIGIESTDVIRIGGGARVLASPPREQDRQFILDHIRTSIRLHEAPKVILMTHSDCGAYGGIGAFGGDPVVEAAFHETELRKAAEFVRQEFPDREVQICFVDFEGVSVVDIAAAD